MYYSPHIQLELARARQQDLIREADRRRLARLVSDERPGLAARIRSFFGERSAKRRSAKQPALRPAESS